MGRFALLILVFLLSSASFAGEVVFWNSVTLSLIRKHKTPPPIASRAMAMVQAAVYDALNSIEQKYSPYIAVVPVNGPVSKDAATATSAYSVLSTLFPQDREALKNLALRRLQQRQQDPSTRNGIILGERAAQSLLKARQNDIPQSFGDVHIPGVWRPTPPDYLPPLLPLWGKVRPFALKSGDQFRQQGPPSLSGDVYLKDLQQVHDFGSKGSTVRTQEQTTIALFWADGAGTETPPGHWNTIAQYVAAERKLDEVNTARLLALLNLALADAAISAWDMKYVYNFWRPVTAFEACLEHCTRPNPFLSPGWEPLIITPPFPEYVSGHSTFSAAAAAVLALYFQTDQYHFATKCDALPGVVRHFQSFTEAAKEAGLSRIYGGIHFGFSNLDGQRAGVAIGKYVSANYLKPRR